MNLFAAGLDWLEGLLPVLFVLFWIVSQVFNAFKAAGKGRPQPPVVRPPRPVADAPRADDIRGQLERQIGEFLERQAGRRGQPAERQRQPGRQRPVTRPQAGRPDARSGAGREPPPLPTAPTQPRVVERPVAVAAGADVARHVHDAFAHELEHLSTSITPGAAGDAEQRPAVVKPATELVAMLRNPATLRQLILLREVLDRPTDRW